MSRSDRRRRNTQRTCALPQPRTAHAASRAAKRRVSRARVGPVHATRREETLLTPRRGGSRGNGLAELKADALSRARQERRRASAKPREAARAVGLARKEPRRGRLDDAVEGEAAAEAVGRADGAHVDRQLLLPPPMTCASHCHGHVAGVFWRPPSPAAGQTRPPRPPAASRAWQAAPPRLPPRPPPRPFPAQGKRRQRRGADAPPRTRRSRLAATPTRVRGSLLRPGRRVAWRLAGAACAVTLSISQSRRQRSRGVPSSTPSWSSLSAARMGARVQPRPPPPRSLSRSPTAAALRRRRVTSLHGPVSSGREECRRASRSVARAASHSPRERARK